MKKQNKEWVYLIMLDDDGKAIGVLKTTAEYIKTHTLQDHRKTTKEIYDYLHIKQMHEMVPLLKFFGKQFYEFYSLHDANDIKITYGNENIYEAMFKAIDEVKKGENDLSTKARQWKEMLMGMEKFINDFIVETKDEDAKNILGALCFNQDKTKDTYWENNMIHMGGRTFKNLESFISFVVNALHKIRDINLPDRIADISKKLGIVPDLNKGKNE